MSAGFKANRSNSPSTGILDGADVSHELKPARQRDGQQDDGYRDHVIPSASTGVKNANNSQFTNFNPSITHNLDFEITQPLLRGRGRFINRVPILVARSRLDLTAEQVRERVLALIAQAENAYWDVIDQRESLRVRENNLELARAFLERSRRGARTGRDFTSGHLSTRAAIRHRASCRDAISIQFATGRGRRAELDRRRPRPPLSTNTAAADRDRRAA